MSDPLYGTGHVSGSVEGVGSLGLPAIPQWPFVTSGSPLALGGYYRGPMF